MAKTNSKVEKKLKVDVLTPIRYGGARKWGEDLARALKREGIEAQNFHSFLGFVRRIFWTNATLIHSALPLPFILFGKPVFLTIHGDYKKEKNPSNFLRPISIKNARAVTVPSQFLKD